MIKESSFTADWYSSVEKDYQKLDHNLLDKVTHALYLLEKLTDTQLEFIFKGGTCLLLLLEEIKRFSIDIDIVITRTISKEKLSNTLQTIIDCSLFTRFEEQSRYQTEIPKAHFKFFYPSPLDGTESYVLLDILFESSPYNQVIELPINSPFVVTSPPNKAVYVPDIENILGDKLTAFAPNTTGIPYNKGKEMEIIKQLFDVESLFDQAKGLDKIRAAFIKCAKQELIYRELSNMDPDDVLDDILKTACFIGGRGSSYKETFLKLEDGIRRIKSHIICKNYILEEAVVSASKAAYLACLIKSNHTTNEHYDSSKSLPELTGAFLFKKMGKIKKFSPEAYYYFAKAQEISNYIHQTANDTI